MKRRNVVTFLLVLGLLTLSLTACSPGDIQMSIGHRFGNPKVTYMDQKVCVKHICVDCQYTETVYQERNTQVADAQAWDTGFQNLDMTNYSISLGTTKGGKTETERCCVAEGRGYYAVVASDGITCLEECYTIQKEDGTYLTYLRTEGEAMTSLASENDDSYLRQMKKEATVYLSLEGMFEKFSYDAQSGSYITGEPVQAQLYGVDGQSLGTKTLQSISVNIADGQVCCIKANYSEVNEYLEEESFDLCIYNIGFSVIKVPQQVINEVMGTAEAVDPSDYHKYFTFETRNGEVVLKSVDAAISGEILVPSFVGDFPVVEIAPNAFQNCNALTGITIPDSVVTIGDNAFLGCDGLANVHYTGTQTQWESVSIGQTGNEALLGAALHIYGQCAHSYDNGTVIKEPTCGAAGVKVYICGLCDREKTEIIPAHGRHSYGDGVVTEKPSCSDAGIITYTCTECGKNDTEYIAKLEEHTYTNGTCVHCGAQDPRYADDVNEDAEEMDGILGTIVKLLESIIELIFYFK